MENVQIEKKRNRILELDILRGVSIILMVIDHFFYDVAFLIPNIFSDYPKLGFTMNLYDFSRFYWNWDVRVYVRYVIVFIFLALVGVCSSFSKSNLKRGLKLMVVAIGLTIATYIIGLFTGDINITITFGVLHCIALTLIIIGLLEKIIKNKWIYLVLGIVMIVIGIFVSKRSVYSSFYDNNNIPLTILKQIIGLNYCGGDTFPLLINGGQIFIGAFLGMQLYKERKSLFNWDYHNNPITICGRHSLLVYVLHQVLIPLLFGIILLICGFNLAL